MPVATAVAGDWSHFQTVALSQRQNSFKFGQPQILFQRPAHARAALARSHTGTGARGFALDRDGYTLVPAPRAPAAGAAGRPKGLETLSRLADKLPDEDGAHVVDAETAGRLLGVTSRTARRLLHTLVEEGLAWPLPPNRTPQPGRPRQFYRIITEKLARPSQ